MELSLENIIESGALPYPNPNRRKSTIETLGIQELLVPRSQQLYPPSPTLSSHSAVSSYGNGYLSDSSLPYLPSSAVRYSSDTAFLGDIDLAAESLSAVHMEDDEEEQLLGEDSDLDDGLPEAQFSVTRGADSFSPDVLAQYVEKFDPNTSAPRSSANPKVGGSAERPFICKYNNCNRAFSRRADCVRHIKIHFNDRPWECKFCDKRFIQRHALIVHSRSHTGHRPYICDDCGRSFSEASSLSRHRRAHSDSRPFHCPSSGCEKTFARRSTLNRHLRVHGSRFRTRRGSQVSSTDGFGVLSISPSRNHTSGTDADSQRPSSEPSPPSGGLDSPEMSEASVSSDSEYHPSAVEIAAKNKPRPKGSGPRHFQRPNHPVIQISVTGPHGETSPVANVQELHDFGAGADEQLKKDFEDALFSAHAEHGSDCTGFVDSLISDDLMALLAGGVGQPHAGDLVIPIKLEDFAWDDINTAFRNAPTPMASAGEPHGDVTSLPPSTTSFPMPTFLPMSAVSLNNPMMPEQTVQRLPTVTNQMMQPQNSLIVSHNIEERNGLSVQYQHLAAPQHHTRHLSLGAVPLAVDQETIVYGHALPNGNAPNYTLTVPGDHFGDFGVPAGAAAATAGRHGRINSAPALGGLDIRQLALHMHSYPTSGQSPLTSTHMVVSPVSISPTAIAPPSLAQAAALSQQSLSPSSLASAALSSANFPRPVFVNPSGVTGFVAPQFIQPGAVLNGQMRNLCANAGGMGLHSGNSIGGNFQW
ncbi:hypothetical protein HDU93_000210 [Gonapodya sp. JEL0774]|nr:hypothetical protein HDU93_000210 [Gonapodya sp. JEL0774]